ncbi:MAG: alpha/beta fold hydrolase, partial [Bacteroidia bacterium]|nr:alpha/beta fold hydrolase [Bacteroidia bacterium]
ARDRQCIDFKNTLPKKYKQVVIENWETPNKNKKIKIFFYYTNFKENKTPILFLNGGPGRSSFYSYELLKEEIEKRNLPIVFVDQRGTGCSSLYPEASSAENLLRLQHYGSTEIVDDLEIFRKKYLKNKKWILFGQSYGGMIAYRYLEKYPNSLESIVVHGASLLPVHQNSWIDRLRSQIRVAQEYFKKYPQDENHWNDVRSRISKTNCFSDKETKICGPGVLDSAVILSGFQNQWPTLHEWIQQLYLTRGKQFDLLLKQFVQEVFFKSYLGPGASFASLVEWLENPNAAQEDECTVAQKTLQSENLKPENLALNECRIFTQFEQKYFAFLKNVTLNFTPFDISKIKLSLNKNKKIMLYVFGSENDNFVSKDSYGEQKKIFGDQMELEILSKVGHEAFYKTPKVFDLLEQLLTE